MARDEDDESNRERTSSESSSTHGGSPGGFYDNFDAKEILGKGLSSTVRRCVERATGKEYAVKILDVTTEKMTQDQAAELRVSTMSEISVLRTLADHKNIIQLHDFYSTPTFLFVVFELARGGELFDYLTEVVTLSEKKTRSIMRQLLEAVAYMHDRNIIHRDLKPENVLMISDETIKVTDFGFAVQLTKGSPPLTELCGTPGYLAPEMLRASMYEDSPGYGLEIDLWACGVIMYTLLCGYAPFFHRRQMYMLRAISEGKYEFRSPEWDEISASAKDMITNLLVVDPAGRYTAREALSHPFLVYAPVFEVKEEKIFKFDARKRFRSAALQVRALVRLSRIKKVPQLIPIPAVQANPYSSRKIRRQIDAVAFRVYAHWVKKGREQYRDALFANALQQDVDRKKSSRISTGDPGKHLR